VTEDDIVELSDEEEEVELLRYVSDDDDVDSERLELKKEEGKLLELGFSVEMSVTMFKDKISGRCTVCIIIGGNEGREACCF